MKYAKHLITQWHDKDIDGQRIKCQLELNPKPNGFASSIASSGGRKQRNHSQSRPREDDRSLPSSQGTSEHDDTDNMNSVSFDNRESERDSRISGKALQDIITQTSSKTHSSRASMIESKCMFHF